MTATAIFASPDAVTILSDSASHDGDWIVREFGSKQLIRPAARWAMTAAGPGAVLDAMAAMLGHMMTLDAVVTSLADAGHDLHRELSAANPAFPHGPEFVVVVGGFLANGVGSAWIMTSQTAYGLEAFVPINVRAFARPEASTEQLAALGIDDTGAQERLGPVEFGRRLIIAMRRTGFDADGRRVSNIGGYVEATTITVGGVETRIVHRWPDRLGEMIDPGG